MSPQEKKVYMTMFTGIFVNIIYWIYVYNNYLSISPEAMKDISLWATLILIMMPIRIVSEILVHIIFAIILKVKNDEDLPSDSMDEYERLIELKTLRINHYIFIFGFIISMFLISFDYPAYIMILAITISGFASEITGLLAKLHFYRKGVSYE